MLRAGRLSEDQSIQVQHAHQRGGLLSGFQELWHQLPPPLQLRVQRFASATLRHAKVDDCLDAVVNWSILDPFSQLLLSLAMAYYLV